MATLEGESGRNKVPIDRVAAAAYRIVFGRLGRVLELAWLPVLVLLAVRLLPGLVSDYLLTDATAAAGSRAADIGEGVIATICLSAFAVRWQHLVLAADRPLSVKRFVVVWARFLGYSLPFCLAIIGAAAGVSAALDAVSSLLADHTFGGLGEPLTQNLASAVVAIIVLTVILALARSSLVFPAVVIGQPLGLIEAWRRMRGNAWRFIAATLLVTAPIVLLDLAIIGLVLDGVHLTAREALEHAPLGVFLLDGVLDVVLAFLLVALSVTVLADFYRRLVLHVRSS